MYNNNYSFGFQDPLEQQQEDMRLMQAGQYQPGTDFGRVSMGQPTEYEQTQGQAETYATMDEANRSAAGDFAPEPRAAFEYTSAGASDSEALGEGMFAFGLALLASSSRPGANFGEGLAQGLAQGASTFSGALNRNKRFENRQAMEDKGFTQESIDAFIKSGNNKDLAKGPAAKSEWSAPNKDGYISNKFTGEVKQAYQKGPEDDWSPPNSAGWSINKKTGESKQVHAPVGKGSGSGSGSGGSGGKPDWKKTFVEWQDQETKEMVSLSVYADENNPGSFSDMNGNAIRLPDNAKLTSETAMDKREEKRWDSREAANKVASMVDNTSTNVMKMIDDGLFSKGVSGVLSPIDTWESTRRFENSRSQIMVDTYSDMAGIAGASVKTEEALIKSAPSVTDTDSIKLPWAKDYLVNKEKMVDKAINYHKKRYNYVPEELLASKELILSYQEQVDSRIKTLGSKKETQETKSKDAYFSKPTVGQLPGGNTQPNNPYAGAAMASQPVYQVLDPSKVKFTQK